MWVYYAVVAGFLILIAIKVVDVLVATVRNQRESVRKQDFLDALIETLLVGK